MPMLYRGGTARAHSVHSAVQTHDLMMRCVCAVGTGTGRVLVGVYMWALGCCVWVGRARAPKQHFTSQD